MANVSIDLYESNDAIVGTDLTEIYQPASGGIRREKKVTETEKADWYADNMVFDNGLKLATGRTAFQENISATITASGYWTFAFVDDVNNFEGITGVFDLEFARSTLSAECAVVASNLSKNHQNTSVKKTLPSQVEGTGNYIADIRLVKSDSVGNSGFKLQARVVTTVSTFKLYVAMKRNFSQASKKGFQLVTPYLDNTPTLPDGVTVGTFLVAGEEVTINGVNVIPAFVAYKVTNDTMKCNLLWPELPKQGTAITLTLPTVNFSFRDGSNIGTVTGAHTISTVSINGRYVEFQLTETGLFTAFTSGQSAWGLVNGGGFKITIT